MSGKLALVAVVATVLAVPMATPLVEAPAMPCGTARSSGERDPEHDYQPTPLYLRIKHLLTILTPWLNVAVS